MDVTGYCAGGLRLHDSNPGTIRFSPGGVGRNIAAALAGRGHEVSLITCLSDDAAGLSLSSDCAKRGIDLSNALTTAICWRR